jgi:hypothetical protein
MLGSLNPSYLTNERLFQQKNSLEKTLLRLQPNPFEARKLKIWLPSGHLDVTNT